MICGSGGSKSRLAKAAGAKPSGETRNEKLNAGVSQSRFGSQNAKKHINTEPSLEVEMLKKRPPLWRKAHVEVKMAKAPHARRTFGS